MKTDRETLCTLLYRLADLVELAKRLPPEDRPALERMIAQVREAVCEARRLETRKRTRLTTDWSIMRRILDKGAHSKPEFRSRDDASNKLLRHDSSDSNHAGHSLPSRASRRSNGVRACVSILET